MTINPGSDHTLNKAVLSGPNLHPWDSGPAVAELQELLNAHGFRLKVDGDFGALTEAAVTSFQAQHGLRIDSIVGPKTRIALKTTIQPGTRILRQGHTGIDVFEVQGLLQVSGYTITRNGIFCHETRLAVLDFQRSHKLHENGMVDPITWTVLRGKPGLPKPPKQRGWLINIRKWW